MSELWKTRIDKTIYNLIYPAFFGNMIYDLILRKLSWVNNATLSNTGLISCLLIVIFAIVDFMHLYGDMNEIVKSPKNKSVVYLSCDIATPFLLFLSFVFVKEQSYRIGFSLFFLIPCIILQYKKKNPNNKVYFNTYALFCILSIIIISFVDVDLPVVGLALIAISLIIYSSYVIYYYPKKSRQFDENYFRNDPDAIY